MHQSQLHLFPRKQFYPSPVLLTHNTWKLGSGSNEVFHGGKSTLLGHLLIKLHIVLKLLTMESSGLMLSIRLYGIFASTSGRAQHSDEHIWSLGGPAERRTACPRSQVTACSQCRDWQQAGSPRSQVNRCSKRVLGQDLEEHQLWCLLERVKVTQAAVVCAKISSDRSILETLCLGLGKGLC